MSKIKLTLQSGALAIALVLALGAASMATPPPGLAVSTDAAGTTEAASDAAVATAGPAVTPLAGLTAVSPTQPWVTEVRVPVVIENVTTESVPAELTSLQGLRFSIRDSSGTSYFLDSARPARGAAPGHALRFLDPAIAARWTLGFQVPTANASDLVLELAGAGGVAASWPMADLPTDFGGPDPQSVAVARTVLGEEFSWADGVAVTATAVGSLVCGDPGIETVTQIVAVAFDVTNSSTDVARWPGFVNRDGASVAQWSDGTAADMSMETFVGDTETLPRVSTFAVRIPPFTSSSRALVFAAPRDGRFTDTTTLPEGTLLNTGKGRVWLDLTAATATLPISPSLCDLGFFDAPVQFAFAPGPKFQVGGETAVADAATLDAAAQRLLTEAVAGAALYYDSQGRSFNGVSGEDLVALAPRISFAGHDVGDDIAGTLGTIYFDTRPDDGQYIYMVTRSASGRWFCVGATPYEAAIAADGFVLADITGVCFPDTIVEEM